MKVKKKSFLSTKYIQMSASKSPIQCFIPRLFYLVMRQCCYQIGLITKGLGFKMGKYYLKMLSIK